MMLFVFKNKSSNHFEPKVRITIKLSMQFTLSLSKGTLVRFVRYSTIVRTRIWVDEKIRKICLNFCFIFSIQ